MIAVGEVPRLTASTKPSPTVRNFAACALNYYSKQASKRAIYRREVSRVSAHSTTSDVPPDHLPPAHAQAAVAAAKRRAKVQADAEGSANVLGCFLGLGPGGLAPAATVDLDRDQARISVTP